MKSPSFWTAFFALVGVVGCGDVSDSLSRPIEVPCASATEGIQQSILVPSCGGNDCHGPMRSALGLDLESPGLEARVVGARSAGCTGELLVVAGDPDRSQLYRKVNDAMPVCGSRMPLGGPQLSAGQRACLAT